MLLTKPFTCHTAPFWKTVADLSYFKGFGFPIVRPFPHLASIAARYGELSARMTPEFTYLPKGQQFFVQDVYMDSSDDYKYELIWDIHKAQQLIQQHQLPVHTIDVADILPSIDSRTLNAAYLSIQKAQDATPIILAEFTLINEMIIIDGNHRLFSRHQYRTGSNIPCYLLPHDIMIQALADPKFVQLYQMHHNLTVMANYMFGNIPQVSYDPNERNQTIRLYDI